MRKVSKTYGVGLAIEQQRDVFCKCLHSSALFYGAVPIPYAQEAILNLPHPYLRTSTILLVIRGEVTCFFFPVQYKLKEFAVHDSNA